MNIANVKQAAVSARLGGVSPTFTISPETGSFFTINGGTLNASQTTDFKNGKGVFYFAGIIDVQANGTDYEVPFCGMNFGDPRVVMDCPV